MTWTTSTQRCCWLSIDDVAAAGGSVAQQPRPHRGHQTYLAVRGVWRTRFDNCDFSCNTCHAKEGHDCCCYYQGKQDLFLVSVTTQARLLLLLSRQARSFSIFCHYSSQCRSRAFDYGWAGQACSAAIYRLHAIYSSTWSRVKRAHVCSSIEQTWGVIDLRFKDRMQCSFPQNRNTVKDFLIFVQSHAKNDIAFELSICSILQGSRINQKVDHNKSCQWTFYWERSCIWDRFAVWSLSIGLSFLGCQPSSWGHAIDHILSDTAFHLWGWIGTVLGGGGSGVVQVTEVAHSSSFFIQKRVTQSMNFKVGHI